MDEEGTTSLIGPARPNQISLLEGLFMQQLHLFLISLIPPITSRNIATKSIGIAIESFHSLLFKFILSKNSQFFVKIFVITFFFVRIKKKALKKLIFNAI